MPRLRDPDEATRRVADEVRELAAITKGVVEASRTNAEIAQATNVQIAALVGVVDQLNQTTKEGIAAGEARDRAGARRESVLIGLTWALVFLAFVTLLVAGVPLARDLWRETESLRSFGSLVLWFVDRMRP